jgi:hypothetical protein
MSDTDTESKELLLAQIEAIRRKRYPLSSAERELLVSLVKQLNLSRR